MVIAWTILVALAAYAAVGAVFATCFLIALVERIDPATRGAPWTFRAIIWPGCVALWPVLLVLTIRSRRTA